MPRSESNAIPSAEEIDRLAVAIHLLIRALLVAGRAGAPAEGRIPFNPLYFHILGLLMESGSMRPTQLAEILGVPRSTLSTASKALQARGLVNQAPDPSDGRAQILTLSKEGVEVANAIKRQDRKNMKLLLQLVDTKRRKIIIDVLEELSRAATAQPES